MAREFNRAQTLRYESGLTPEEIARINALKKKGDEKSLAEADRLISKGFRQADKHKKGTFRDKAAKEGKMPRQKTTAPGNDPENIKATIASWQKKLAQTTARGDRNKITARINVLKKRLETLVGRTTPPPVPGKKAPVKKAPVKKAPVKKAPVKAKPSPSKARKKAPGKKRIPERLPRKGVKGERTKPGKLPPHGPSKRQVKRKWPIAKRAQTLPERGDKAKLKTIKGDRPLKGEKDIGAAYDRTIKLWRKELAETKDPKRKAALRAKINRLMDKRGVPPVPIYAGDPKNQPMPPKIKDKAKPKRRLGRKGKAGLLIGGGLALAEGARRLFGGKKEQKKPVRTEKPGGKSALFDRQSKKIQEKMGKKAPVAKKPVQAAKKPMPKTKKSPIVRGKEAALKRPTVNVYSPQRKRLDAAMAMKGNEGIQAKEAAIAGFATVLASQVPGINRTANDIAGVLGKNLKSLGLAGLGAGTVYLIAKELAAHRKQKPSPTASGIRKGLDALKGDNKGKSVSGYRPRKVVPMNERKARIGR